MSAAERVLTERNPHEIADRLRGRRVTKVSDDTLQLDDGTTWRLVGNNGCGGCTAGFYALTELNGVDNIITNVEVVDGRKYGSFDRDSTWSIFVYADNRRVNLATFTGDDENGYYGTGFQITITGAPQSEGGAK
jgi:hypothetical protein